MATQLMVKQTNSVTKLKMIKLSQYTASMLTTLCSWTEDTILSNANMHDDAKTV